MLPLLFSALAALPLAGQQLRGRVLVGTSDSVIAGAMVEVQDSAGQVLQSRVTSTDGHFLFTLGAPGAYRYRVAAIGFVPWPATPVLVPGAGLALPDVRLTRQVVRLPDLESRASRQYCGNDRLGDSVFVRLLDSARDALRIIETTIRSGTIAFDVEQVHSRILYRPITNFERADTNYVSLASWPVRSIDSDSLRRFGFMRELWNRDGANAGRFFYGPDARVLFSTWFLESHCFSLARINSATGVLRLQFKPLRKSPLVDISGVLTLDASTLALQSLEFSHQNLPSWMGMHSAGGEMLFRQLPNGLWITTYWALWGPIEGMTLDARSEMGGVAESRGRVVRMIRQGGEPGSSNR